MEGQVKTDSVAGRLTRVILIAIAALAYVGSFVVFVCLWPLQVHWLIPVYIFGWIPLVVGFCGLYAVGHWVRHGKWPE